jgi:hypothetical protein
LSDDDLLLGVTIAVGKGKGKGKGEGEKKRQPMETQLHQRYEAKFSVTVVSTRLPTEIGIGAQWPLAGARQDGILASTGSCQPGQKGTEPRNRQLF